MMSEFYPLWGIELISEVYNYVFVLESTDSAAE